MLLLHILKINKYLCLNISICNIYVVLIRLYTRLCFYYNRKVRFKKKRIYKGILPIYKREERFKRTKMEKKTSRIEG